MQTLGPDVEETDVSRSFLFVPADSERKLAKAKESDADALIIDLEDSVAAAARKTARRMAREFLADGADMELWVRVNPVASIEARADLRQVMPAAPFGVVLPKPDGAKDAIQLARMLGVLERQIGLCVGQTKILPIATERPAAIFHLHEYASATSRLGGLTWGAEDLGAAVGAMASRDDKGSWLAPFELARSLCLFAAAAASVPAIDTVYTDYRDLDGLARYAAGARREGFEGMLAIHPDQVPVINDAFLPTDDEIARARRIVGLFEKNPTVGSLGIDGAMIDRPHWLQAKRILERAERLR